MGRAGTVRPVGWRRAVCAAGLLAVLAGVVTGCGALDSAAPAPGTDRTTASGLGRVDPASVDIPRIGARSSLVPLGLNADGTVQVPPVSQPLQAGWYSGGVAPGQAGAAVLLGHVDGDHQLGVFNKLHELAAGDEIDVTRKDGTSLRFVVRHVDEVPKSAFPTEAVYGATADPQLRVITCGGSFDRAKRSYRDNIIVYATLAGPA